MVVTYKLNKGLLIEYCLRVFLFPFQAHEKKQEKNDIKLFRSANASIILNLCVEALR